ncbi:hypothetical protein [Marinilabilia salmonicolor]|uniref:hypothetical protein n=1 Tax=Marinilabilia salmonicolor TaxID=989 RepID=UPI00029AD34B|nr:hypothetical protein [Marinilabilia salmonicolor]
MDKNIISTIRIKGFGFFLLLSMVFCPALQGQSNQVPDTLTVSHNRAEGASGFNQEEIITKQKLFTATFFAHGGQFEWTHSNPSVALDPVRSYGGGVAFNFRIVKWLELSTGAGLSLQSTEGKVGEVSASMPWIDDEGDTFEKRVSATGVEETQKYTWAEFPFLIRGFVTVGKWDLFAEAGAEYRLPVKSTYEQNGMFTHQGYYEEYDLLLDNLPDLGYYTDYPKWVDDADLELDNILMPFAGIGVVFPGQNYHLFFEARYYFPGNDPFTEKQDILFPGPENNSSAALHQNLSIMNQGEISLSGFRGMLGIRF